MARLTTVSLVALAWALAAAPSLAQDEPPAAPEVMVEPQAAALGDTVTGDLVEGDSFTTDDGLMDRYVLDLQAGTPVEITMRSEAFDTYLVAGFMGPNGWEEIGVDDDGLGEGLNSRLAFLAAETGRYEVRARGFFAMGAGAYTLNFARGADMAAGATPGSIVVGGTASGALTTDDAPMPGVTGYTYDAYRLQAAAGQRLAIIARSDAFDMTVQVGSGSRWGMFSMLGYDDDGLGEGLNSRLLFTPPTTGEYEIRIAGLGENSLGDYTLEVVERDPLPAPTAIAFAQPVSGLLEAGDGEGDDLLRYDAYGVRLAAGQRIEAVADSTSFDTILDLGSMVDGIYVPLTYDEGSMDGSFRSQSRFTADADGDYILRVGSYDAAASGAYSLSLTDRGPLPPPPPPGAVSVGADVTGSLSDTDGVQADDRFYDDYVMAAQAGRRLSITLRSPTYDTYLDIGRYGESGVFETIVADDDSAGDLDSRAIFEPDAAGDYVVRVTSYSAGETGDYTLTTRDLGPEPEPQPLRIGRTVRGELNDRDGMSDDEARYDPYSLTLEQGQRIQFVARSDGFDTLLGVSRHNPDFGREFLAVDDDGLGEGANSRLVFEAPEAGQYELWVTAYDGAGRGDYTLESEDIGPAPQPVAITMGQTVRGELDARDRLAGDATFYDAYRFSGEEGRRVQIDMRSADMDTFILLGRNGEYGLEAIAENDDGMGEGTDSRLLFTLPATGEYEVWANSFAPGMVGAYELTLTDMGLAPQPGSLVVGSTVRGALGPEDNTDEFGVLYEAYRVQLAAGERVRITVTSNAFDTLVQAGRMIDGVYQQDGIDDDGLSDTNSRLDFTAPEAGEYILRVRSYAPGEAGEYVMNVEPAPEA